MNNLQPVDRIEILVLIDNKTDSLSSVPAHTTLEWKNLMKAGMQQLSGSCQCCANYGLALIVTAYRGGKKHTILFDAGPVEFAVEYNGRRLGTRFGEINAIVLSHGHWDHAGGLPKALDLILSQNNQKRIPCYLHPGMFRKRALPLPGGQLLPIQEIPSSDELSAHGANPVITDGPVSILDDMFFISGEIARITPYEKGFPGHMRRTEDGANWEPDPLIMDERYLAVHVKNKGLVIFSACAYARDHQRAARRTRSLRRYSTAWWLQGGIHLSGANEAIINGNRCRLRTV